MISPTNTANALPVRQADPGDLKRSAVRGGTVSLAAQLAHVLVQLASTAILGRLLSPEDYGIMAMAAAITAFAGLFRDFGLSAAAVQKRDLTHSQMSNLFWLNLVLGAILTGLVAAAAPAVARFYGQTDLLPLTLVISLNFLLASVATQHAALLDREFRFESRATATILGAAIGLCLSITLAVLGHRYWSLAWGGIAATAATSALLIHFSGFRPSLWTSRAGIRAMFRFGANVTAFEIVNYFHRNLDNILIGRLCGTSALGFYSRAYSLLMLPINTIRGPLNAVAFPALSSLQSDPERYRAFYQRFARYIALGSMPLAGLLYFLSEEIVAIILGRNWMHVVPIFSILAFVALVQPSITTWGVVALSRGMSRRYLQMGIFNTTVSVIGFAVGVAWGPLGVAMAYLIVTYATAIPILAICFKGTPLTVTDFFNSVWRPFIATLFGLVLSKGIVSLPFLCDRGIPDIFLKGAFFAASFLAALLVLPGGACEIRSALNLLPARVQKLLFINPDAKA